MKNETTTTVATALPTATGVTATAASQSYFSRKIGNTTFMVSVSFSDKAAENMEDKIIRLVASDIQREVQKCS